MTQYRIYAFREDGHFSTVRRLECTDRDQAVQKAQQILDGQDGELWESEHLIALRNRFAHFTPKGWLIEPSGLARIVGVALDIVEELMNNGTRVAYRLEEGGHQNRFHD